MTHSFASYDGTVLACRRTGEGPPLICVPGGPGRSAENLGDLRSYLPFFYGRWNEAARAHAARDREQRNPAVAAADTHARLWTPGAAAPTPGCHGP